MTKMVPDTSDPFHHGNDVLSRRQKFSEWFFRWCCWIGAPLLGLLATLSVVADSAFTAERRPNVVVILADDQGWGDLSVHGNTNLHTPRIDSLANEGALFKWFYACPVCSPTRAEFLTGRYYPRGGVYGVTSGGERLNLDEKTIGDVFQEAGYATGAFGKWHNGMQYPYHPRGRGFGTFYGFCSGHWGNYFSPILESNGTLVRGKGFIIDDLTDHALKFIEHNKDRPFFCYLPFNTPHSPMQVPDRFFNRFKAAKLAMRNRDPQLEDVPKTRAALAMCENIDWNVGRVLEKLDALRLADNTIVVYFSDNGPNSWRWNGGMKGRKGSTDEGGVREPCLIRWPGQIRPGKRIDRIAGTIDLLPTLAELTGVALTPAKPLDGISLKPLLLDTEPAEPGGSQAGGPWSDRMIFSYWAHRVSVRTQRYRLDHAGKLYDMTHDPGQQQDISQEQPAVAERLSRAVAQWKQELLSEQHPDRPFTVGYADFPVTYLPARDGVAHGHVQRSSKAPNCSYFKNWTSTEDRLTWDIEVATRGQYEAVVYYTCAKENIGSTIELSFQGNRIQGVVAEAHDPPQHGAENDRAPRGLESYVKDFKPLRLGVFKMDQGRGSLVLRALEIPGKEVMEVRYVVLTLRKSR